jgi:Arc/MetJ-type ribon-helix-helix transcriptional regulator
MPEEKETNKYTTISIPTPLANKIKQRIEGTGFNSLSSYVTYVLREVISNVEEDEQETAFSKDDEAKVKERLRALGYLD